MDNECVIYRTSNFIGKKWMIPIILEVYKAGGKVRYNYLKKKLPGITPKILSTRLKELRKEGILKKTEEKDSFPLKSEYALTSTGKEFVKVIDTLKDWALKNKIKSESCKDTKCATCIR